MQEYKNNIKKIRKAKRMSLIAVAEASNTSHEQIRRLENGTRRLTQGWMLRIAKALGCKPTDLMDDELTIAPTSESDETLIWELVRLFAEKARELPDMSSDLIAAIGLIVWRDVKSGKTPMPKEKNTSKKVITKALVTQANDLIAYELSRPRV